MSSLLNYNERSWAIEVISEINDICSKLNTPIKRAGGEHTLSMDKGNSLFPDVLLFGDRDGTVAIQGWELKMPDTKITDPLLIENAIKKANRLCLNSFLIWNVKEAVVYVLSDGEGFKPVKNWSISSINKREDVHSSKKLWVNLIKEILHELNNFLDKRFFSPVGIESVLSDKLYKDILDTYLSLQTEIIIKKVQVDADFEIKVDEWFEDNRDEFKGFSSSRALAQVIIVNWINRFLFAHYLKLFNEKSEIIDKIDESCNISNAIEIFEKITKECDFMNVFKPVLGFEYIDKNLWDTMIELNKLLSDFRLESISQASLHMVIDNVLSYSRKKILGQFSTPQELARYLVEITIKDRTKHVMDICCGTGTIAKSAYQLKRDKGISVEESLKTTWASDKYSFPLQLCSIALSDPLGMGQIVQVFQKDVLFLELGDIIIFTDPFSGKNITRELPEIHAIVSNLPFVRFEHIERKNHILSSVRGDFVQNGISLSRKADLYAYITLKLDRLIQNEGRIGLIVSNSWLGVDWGDEFREAILNKFNILRVVISANGRWFKHADVVTTIIVLEKKDSFSSTQNKSIDFITTKQKIANWDRATLDSMVKSSIGNVVNPNIVKQTYSRENIFELEALGFGWNSLFVDFKWVDEVKDSLVQLNQFFEINRGERRGWDNMFYPENGHNIEPEYIRPVLLSTRNLGGNLIVNPDGDAFCCSDDLSTLLRLNKIGAINWIRKFELSVNGTGKPLPEVLKRTGMHWYEMKPETIADIVVSMNPDKKLCFYRLKKRSFVNQRLIRLTLKSTNTDIDLIHALMNSAIGMFILESIGFGRGLGALDINATKLSKKMRILNPCFLDKTQRDQIIDAFEPILCRQAKNLNDELKCSDRLAFDETVIKAFKFEIRVSDVYSSLLNLYNIRQTARL